jgi:hypothetical protein
LLFGKKVYKNVFPYLTMLSRKEAENYHAIIWEIITQKICVFLRGWAAGIFYLPSIIYNKVYDFREGKPLKGKPIELIAHLDWLAL